MWNVCSIIFRALIWVARCIGVLIVAAALWLVVADGLLWLRTARLPQPYMNSQLLHDIGLASPLTSWMGLQRLIDQFLHWPAWTGLLVASILPFALATLIAILFERIDLLVRRRGWQQTNDWRRNTGR